MDLFIADLLLDSALILIPIIYFFIKKKDIKKELGFFSKGPKKDLKNTLILFIALTIFSLIISITANIFGLNDLGKVAENIETIKTTAPLMLAYFLIVRVVSEEIFFRGFLVKKIGIIGSSLIFGFAHIAYGSVIEVIGATVLGYILARAFLENKNILPNIVAHFFYNFLFLMAVL